MDRITAMKVFLTVAECGSFTQAAEQLDCSKAMVSRHIALIENWLQARLLQRTTRHVSLTAEGEQAVQYCRQIIGLADEIELEIEPASGELEGIIRLTCSNSFGIRHLTPAITAFGKLHPKLGIHLSVGDNTLNLVESRIDLAIRISNHPDPTLIARPLGICRSQLTASSAYLAEYGTPNSPQELAAHCCLSHTHLNRGEWRFSDGKQTVIHRFNSVLASNDALVLLSAVQNHSGIAMLPRYLLDELSETSGLKNVLSDWTLPEMTIYALYPSRRQLPRKVRLLLDFLITYFQEQDW